MKILVCVKQVPRLDEDRFRSGIDRVARAAVIGAAEPVEVVAEPAAAS